MVTIDAAARFRTECWLRRHGLPYFVTAHARRTLLFARITPFLITVLALHGAGWLAARTDLTIGDDALEAFLLAIGAMGTTAVLIGAPIAAFAVTARLLRSRPRFMRPVGALTTAYFLLVDPWFGEVPLEGLRLPVAATAVDVLVVGAALLATWAGIGSVAGWAARTSVRQLSALGEMSTRALPLLMLVVFFSFFAPAIWVVTNAMSADRLAGVVAFFVLLGLLFIVPVTRTELHGVDENMSVDERADLIDQTDLRMLLDAPVAPGPLSRAERANLQAVLILAQGAQVGIFSGLVAAFLIGLGRLALSPSIVSTWVGGDVPQVMVFGLATGVDVALVKTAIFLSCVSSLNFLISATSNAAYKSAFYDPLFSTARVALAVRSAYRA